MTYRVKKPIKRKKKKRKPDALKENGKQTKQERLE